MVEEWGRLPEVFLQMLWNEGCGGLGALRTACGHELRVRHPGTWNVSDGPDFRDGTLLVDGREVHGDIEVHRRSLDWERHGHGGDVRYRGVVLHVVWESDGELRDGPAETLVLGRSVGSEWVRLLHELEESSYPYARRVGRGRCAVMWALSEDGCLRSLLSSSGLRRLEEWGERLGRRCAECGADQALYESFFECLGYGRNRGSFRELAEMVRLEWLGMAGGADDWAALLFGGSGLLPDVTCEELLPEWRDEVARLWARFWALGGQLHSLSWVRSGRRPFNSPERRLAAGVSWLRETELRPALWLTSRVSGVSSSGELVRRLQGLVPDDVSWHGYVDFSHRVRTPASLLGALRWRDMVAHVLLPYLLATGMSSELIREAYLRLPTGEGNRVLSEAAHRFLTPPSRARELLRHYAQQQGLMDIYRRYCLSVNGECQNCPLWG